MMQLKVLASMSVVGGLLGCSTIQPGIPASKTAALHGVAVPTQFERNPIVPVAEPSPAALYDMGRAAHGSGQLAKAIQLYERVLALDPNHSGALNALGVVLAQEGRSDAALALLARASEQTPDAAHIHNNLGYVLLKADRLDEAQVALRLARDLDPGSLKMLQNLELLAQAQREKAARNEVSPAEEVADNGVGPRLLAVAPNIFELRTMGPQAIEAAAAASAVAQPEVAVVALVDRQEPVHKLALSRLLNMQGQPFPTWNDAHDVHLEVSNGVGIPRLARRTADRLAEKGVATTRLTNARHFQHERTQVQYLAGQEDALKALMTRLPIEVQAVQVDRLDARVQIRLVLGHDVAGRAIAAWSQSGDALLAVAKPALDRGGVS